MRVALTMRLLVFGLGAPPSFALLFVSVHLRVQLAISRCCPRRVQRARCRAAASQSHPPLNLHASRQIIGDDVKFNLQVAPSAFSGFDDGPRPANDGAVARGFDLASLRNALTWLSIGLLPELSRVSLQLP